MSAIKQVLKHRQTQLEKALSKNGEEEEGLCWEGKVCQTDEFGHCVVCCDCKACIRNLREEAAAEEDDEEGDAGEGAKDGSSLAQNPSC